MTMAFWRFDRRLMDEKGFIDPNNEIKALVVMLVNNRD